MRIKDLIKAIKAVTVFTAFASLVSCKSEIVDGTTDIDSWPLPSIEVTYPETFVHPGVAFSQEDIDRWRKIVKDHVSPQYEGFEVLKNDKLSQANYVLNGPYNELYAGEGEGRPSIYIQYANDFAAACQCAIMFAATGQKSYADKALEVIRSYAKTVKGGSVRCQTRWLRPYSDDWQYLCQICVCGRVASLSSRLRHDG